MNPNKRQCCGGPTIEGGQYRSSNEASEINYDNTGSGLAAEDVQDAIDELNAVVSSEVVGPASAVDNTIARFDTTTGKLIQGSTVVISDSGLISGTPSAYEYSGGLYNMVAGANAGSLIGAGAISNVMTGDWAGQELVSGDNNIFYGVNAGRHQGGSMNTFLGTSSGRGVTGVSTGSNNTYVGGNAGVSSTTASDCTALGQGTDVVAGGQNQTAIGQGVVTTTNNEVVLGNTAVTHIRSVANCDLGTSAKPFKDIYLNGSVVSSGAKLPANPPEELIQPILTSNTGNPTFQVEASSEFGGQPAWYAFGNLDSPIRWISGANTYSATVPTGIDAFLGNPGSWLKVVLSTPKFISTLRFLATAINGTPADYTVYGSMDGTNWTAVHVGSNGSIDSGLVGLDTPSHVKYIVFHITSLNGSDTNTQIKYIVFGGTEVVTPVLTSNTSHSNFIVSDSDNLTTTYNAFDGSAATTWGIASGYTAGVGDEWIKTSFGHPTYITGYRVQLSVAPTTNRPDDWTIEVSNDDTTWFVCHTVEGGAAQDTGVLYLDQPVTCRYIRMRCTKVLGSGSSWFMSELTYYSEKQAAIDGYLTVNGGMEWTQPRCELHWEDNATPTTLTLANTFYKLTGGTPVSDHNVQFLTDVGTTTWNANYQGLARKVFHVGCTYTVTPSTAGDYEFAVFKNGVKVNGSVSRFDVTNATDQYNGANHVFVELGFGDLLDFYGKNLGSAGTTVELLHFNLFADAMGAPP